MVIRPLLTRVSRISRRAVLWVRCVKWRSILLREVKPHQVDEVSVAIAREGEELVSLQDQLRNKMEESKARRTEEEARDF